jgi:hypothetical protein
VSDTLKVVVKEGVVEIDELGGRVRARYDRAAIPPNVFREVERRACKNGTPHLHRDFHGGTLCTAYFRTDGCPSLQGDRSPAQCVHDAFATAARAHCINVREAVEAELAA